MEARLLADWTLQSERATKTEGTFAGEPDCLFSKFEIQTTLNFALDTTGEWLAFSGRFGNVFIFP